MSAYGAVDPGSVELPAVAVDRQPRLAVVQSAEDNIGPAVNTQPEVMHNVAVEEVNVDPRVNLLGGSGGDLGLGKAVVALPEEHGPRQIRFRGVSTRPGRRTRVPNRGFRRPGRFD